jgi:hypothetical protein
LSAPLSYETFIDCCSKSHRLKRQARQASLSSFKIEWKETPLIQKQSDEGGKKSIYSEPGKDASGKLIIKRPRAFIRRFVKDSMGPASPH